MCSIDKPWPGAVRVAIIALCSIGSWYVVWFLALLIGALIHGL